MDNFDDVAEEIERQDDLAQELGSLARRYGRDGLHFILAGAMEGGLSEFKRAVQATNFGLGLRSPGSLDVLRVMRVPAGFRSGKDLAVGRGYAVKSGLPTMLQVASPYDGILLPDRWRRVQHRRRDDRVAQALDHWVETILARHQSPRATWSAAPGAAR